MTKIKLIKYFNSAVGMCFTRFIWKTDYVLILKRGTGKHCNIVTKYNTSYHRIEHELTVLYDLKFKLGLTNPKLLKNWWKWKQIDIWTIGYIETLYINLYIYIFYRFQIVTDKLLKDRDLYARIVKDCNTGW